MRKKIKTAKNLKGTAACSFIPPYLLQDPQSCVHTDAPCKRYLAFDKAKPLAFKMQSHDRAMIRQICNSNVATIKSQKLTQFKIYKLDVILRPKKKRLSFVYVVSSSGASRQPVTNS